MRNVSMYAVTDGASKPSNNVATSPPFADNNAEDSSPSPWSPWAPFLAPFLAPFEMPNVTDIIEKSQSNISKNPSESEK